MSDRPWMIYGANGYTGTLAAEKAVEEGLRPVLAGRSADRIRPIATRLGLEWRAFDLGDLREVAKGIKNVDLVLHCAGPFSRTSAPMVEACLKTGTHYLDITGEIDVFEAVHARGEEAKRAGSVLLPGVGFDVVPSDCLAAMVAGRVNDPTDLEIGFTALGKISPGTLKTMIENLPEGGRERRDGVIRRTRPAEKAKKIPFSRGTRWAVAIPWGDVSTAYYSTGVPNITTYMAVPHSQIRLMRLSRPFAPVLGLKPVQRVLKGLVDRFVKGPNEEERARGRVHLWARAVNRSGDAMEATLDVPEGYRFTVLAALACTRGVLSGDVPPGAWTPASAFGADFVTRLPETELKLPA